MKDDILGALESMKSPRSTYSVEEIEAAKKRKKKNGGTLMDNLSQMTGKVLPSPSDLMNNSRILDAQLEEFSKELKSYEQSNSEKLEQPKTVRAASENAGSVKKDENSQQSSVDVNKEDALDAFSGLSDELNKVVFGQEDFNKKLVVAFKRPFVMRPEEGMPLNSIFITGPECSGKHLALNTLCRLLGDRKITATNNLYTMDLSLYPNASEEKLFLQDLYSALSSPSNIIVFENYEKCHTSLITRVADLVMKGKCNLSERYVMQNGQLVNVNNALASKAVGSLSAKGKYLVIISSRNITKLSDAFGAPFVNCISDICESGVLSEEALRKISLREKDTLIENTLKNARFNLKLTDEVIDYSLTMSEKNAGLMGILTFYKNLLKAMSELRLNGDYKKNAEVTIEVNDGIIEADIEGEKVSLMSVLPKKYTGELDAVKAEMDNIVGLQEIKEYILGLEEYFGIQKRRREAGLKASELNKHMIFTGNPGTGKTTIARIISRYLKAIGVLSGGQLVEVSRADLVGRYVGHTAPLTNQVINSAIGGVLFIDEAYSLYRGKDDSFGMEAIDTLVKGIEDNRDDLIVILAGYSKEMEEFLTANSGLKSRFPNIINFPDYTGEELMAIADITAKSKGYVIDDGVRPALLAYFNAVQLKRARDAGNGRLVRNKIEDAILNQSRRLVADKDAEMSTLTSMDFELDDI